VESEALEHGLKRRLTVVWMGTLVGVLILAGRLFYWQVIRHQELLLVGEQLRRQDRPIPSLRGTIRDRHGFVLAIDRYEFEVFATPRDFQDPEGLASELAPVLQMDQGVLSNLLSQRDAPYVPLVRDASMETAREVERVKDKWDAGGLGITPARKRVYPDHELGCHLLGFVTQDHEIDYRVFYGVEESYDEALRGSEGSWAGTSGIPDLQIAVGSSKLVLPQDGRDVVLTVDRTIQQIVEDALQEGIAQFGAGAGTIIVMDPRTGAILAMASYPTYDPNLYFEGALSEELFRNPAVSEAYEPGSIFKVVTMAAALDSGAVGRYTTYNDTGQIYVGGTLIMNWDRKAYGIMSMTELLGYSLNVGAATLSTSMGPEVFYDYVRRFGFGEVTGIDLPNESRGIVKVPGDGDWREADLGTNAFGQGIAVTPIQMVTAVAAIANHGLLPRPYVVERIEDQGEVVQEFQPQPGRQVISPSVAQDLTEMLTEAVAASHNLDIQGYSIAGKTGTAQIPVPGGYHPSDTIASFVGFAPVGDPQFVVLIKMDRPQQSPWGAVVAVPVFRQIAEGLFAYLGIPPDDVRMASR
jgi:cell division protein FtsI (penicillin-binding protein 3)